MKWGIKLMQVQINKLDQNIKTKPEKYVIFYLILMTFEYITEYYWQNGSTLAMLIFRFMTLNAVIFPGILLLYYKPKLDLYRIYFLCIFIFNLMTTLIYLCFGEGRNISNIGIYFGMLSAFFMAQIELEVLHNAFKKIAYFGCIMLIYVFVFLEIDIAIALRRGYTWTEIFFYASFYWAVIPFVIMSFLKEKYVKISIVYWMGAITLNLIFLKRFIIVDSILLVGIICVIIYAKNNAKLKRFLKATVYIALILLISLIVFGDVITSLFDSVVSRFLSAGENIRDFDRFVESQNYLETVNNLDVLIGKGFLGTHFGLGQEADALHVGWSNFLLKGGIFLISVIIIPYIKIITLIQHIWKLPVKIQFSVFVMLVFAARLIYTNIHSFTPEMMIFFYCLFNVMDYKYIKHSLKPHSDRGSTKCVLL